ncbi:unnamed protein product [Allacma fusca]|uniref:Uncharacterized protein n=1 Tax=Allacma fusca TaxID=39272 RepID=A0A8J2KSB5_9HEXA|nr:unnamed protein product [Allacma fusca]
MVGRQFIDPHVQNDMKTWPFKIESDKAGRPLIVVKNKRFSPEEVTAEVLKHLKKLAENHLKRSVTKAVITVPTYFNNRQREATRQSALLAGLEVLQIINEPTAAAMPYSLRWKNEEKTIISVFNFGGRTFDVTILKTKLSSTNATDYQSSPATSREDGNVQIQYGESRLQILQTGGDTHLGGDSCNNAMVLHCAETFRQQHGIQLLKVDDRNTGAHNVQQDMRRLRRLKNACEKAKIILTSESSVTVEVERIHGYLDLNVHITRSEFERMDEQLFQKTIDIVRKTIQGASLNPGDITDVLMVGGSSKIPRVRKLLQDFVKLPILDINQQVDIQEAVVTGAAIQACVLDPVFTKHLPLRRDIQPFSVGMKSNWGKMAVIIPRNTKIPCECSKTFTHVHKNRNYNNFHFYIGEEEIAESNIFLKTMKLEGIPPVPGDLRIITVQMKIDTNGVLNVTVSIRMGPSSTLTIQDCRGRYSDEDLGTL